MRNPLLVVCVFLAVSSAAIAAEPERFDVPLGNSPRLGPANAPVTIIEFLDYQ